MSGIVGIVNLDGAPVDPGLLRGMVDFLAFRGPDAQEMWVDNHVGLGHTMLRTTFESEHERQPFSLDGQVWITADARVDGRGDLIRLLTSQGITNLAGATDVELILRAYHVWGERCLEHLLGDFAFAIWDRGERRLFCARDHLGVKPFYYARVGNCLIFSNTLDCLRQHPSVSDRLNELAIADFLLFPSNQEFDTTAFADIQRLPAAHTATWSQAGFHLRRYWTLPIDEPIFYPRPADYLDHFKELLRLAVDDRLRTNRVGIYMSGGMDSSTVAVTARNLLQERSRPFSLQAFTAVYDHLIPDQERYYAGLVADHLGIPIHFYARDDEVLIPWSEQPLAAAPEPVANPFAWATGLQYQRQIAIHSRVFLDGLGPDIALRCEWRPHLAYLVKKRRWGRLLPDFCYHVVAHRRVPFLGRVRNWWSGYRKRSFPVWLNDDFASRLQLRGRRESVQTAAPLPHPTRPKRYGVLCSSYLQAGLEGRDTISSQASTEMRLPFLDVRLLRYLLAIPTIPWCCNKHLLRRAMRGALPERVLCRPKSPAAGDPDFERARRWGMPQLPASKALSEYINPQRIPRSLPENGWAFGTNFPPIGLAYWLRNLELEEKCIISPEVLYGTTRK